MAGRSSSSALLTLPPDALAALGVLISWARPRSDDRDDDIWELAGHLADAPTPWRAPRAKQAEDALVAWGGAEDLARLWVEATDRLAQVRQPPEVWEGVRPDVRLAIQGRPGGLPDPADQKLRAATGVKGVFVEDPTLAPAPRWNWPLSIGFSLSMQSDEMRREMEGDAHYRERFLGDVPQARHVMLGEDAAECHVALLATAEDVDRMAASRQLRASLVVALDPWVEPRKVKAASRNVGASGWALVPASSIRWGALWMIELCTLLAHDSPLDKAVARAVREASLRAGFGTPGAGDLGFGGPGMGLPGGLGFGAGPGGPVEPDRLGVPGRPEAPGRRANALHLAGHPQLMRGARISEVLRRIQRRARRMARPDLAVAAETMEAHVPWDREAFGSQGTAALNEILTGIEPPEPTHSSLQVQVYGPDDVRRRHTFQADDINTIKVRIGPGDADWLSSGAAFPTEGLTIDERIGRAKITLVVVVPGTEPQAADTWLAPGPPVVSTVKSFDVVAGGPGSRLAVDVYAYHEGRLLQQAVVEGPIAESDEPPAGVGPLHFRTVLIARTALDDLSDRTTFHLSLGTNSAGGVVVHAGGRTVELDPVGLRPIAQDLEALVTKASRTPTPWPAVDNRKFWRTIADQGRQLRQELLRAQLPGIDKAPRIQIAGRAAADVLPLEIVYVGGQPTGNAGPCPGWDEALGGDTCPTCPADPQPVNTPTDTICPQHFWGLSRVIERCLAGPGENAGAVHLSEPNSRRRHLRRFDQALVGVTDLVVHDVAAGPLLTQCLASIKGRGVRLAKTGTWRTWRRRVKEDRPSLLVAIAHNAVADVPQRAGAGGNRLEIGKGDGLDYSRVSPDYVGADEDGAPVVLLLGCNTVDVMTPYRGFTTEFSESGAAVVVGVLAEVWVGDAPVAAAEFVDHLVGGDWQPDATFGDVMLRVRRDLVRAGHPIAMAFAAYGDADWLLPKRPDTPAPPVAPNPSGDGSSSAGRE